MTTASNFDNVSPPKKKNPSKSRQGRAVQVNGATRNPHWAYRPRFSRYTPKTVQGPKLSLTPAQVDNYKKAAQSAAEEARFMLEPPAHPQYALFFWRQRRKFECLVSKALNRCWSVGMVLEDEAFKVQPATLANF